MGSNKKNETNCKQVGFTGSEWAGSIDERKNIVIIDRYIPSTLIVVNIAYLS